MNTTIIGSHWNERWEKVITKFPTKRCDYFISDYGRAKSVDKLTKKENLLKGSILKTTGHRSLNLRLEENFNEHVYIHIYVAKCFVEKESEDQSFVLHKDNNKTNNHWENLQWANQKQLTAFQTKNGVFAKENRKNASHVKMTEEKVRLLKKRLKEGKTKKKILAKSFGITTMQLNRIERGENWGHVKIEEEKIIRTKSIFEK